MIANWGLAIADCSFFLPPRFLAVGGRLFLEDDCEYVR